MNPPNPEYTSSYGSPRPVGPVRPPFDPRSHPLNNGTGPGMRAGSGTPLQAENNASRAQRYDDEKRRIVESCFSKREATGELLESYITHVRINEDAMYPSSPPPPDSAPTNKKSRLILVAVRKSGRVRIHKARENPSGSFSIGKTWALDELTAIHIYAGVTPSTEQERIEKQAAGDLGFTVTLGKPYYWHAPTAKERDFFIASLLKIYKKYTGGKTPEMTGFLPHQMEQLGGNQAIKTPSGPLSPHFATPPPPIPAASQQRSQSPQMQRFSPTPQHRFDHFQIPPPRADLRPHTREAEPPSTEPLRSPGRPDGRMDRGMPGRENMRRSPDMLPGNQTRDRDPVPAIPALPRQQQPPIQHSSPLISQAAMDHRDRQGFPPPRPPNGINSYQRPAPDPSNQSSDFLPTNLAVRDRSFSSAQSSDRPTTATSDTTSAASKTPVPPKAASIPDRESETLQPSDKKVDTLPAPDRKRPFLPRTETNGAHSNDSYSRFVTPATTPSASKVDLPSTSSISDETPKEQKRASPGKVDYFNAVTMPQASEPRVEEAAIPVVQDAASTPVAAEVTTAEPEEMSSPGRQQEDHRPGLGPMVKKKNNVADTFRKAAFAVNAFKPRQGGGAARLKAMQEEGKKGNAPDGITGVVPAPLLRGMSSDSVGSNRPVTPGTPGLKEQPTTPSFNAVPPRLALQRTATENSVMSQQSQLSNQSTMSKELLASPALGNGQPAKIEEPVRLQMPERARSRSPQRWKRQRQEADIAKFSSSLGVDPRIFEGRGADFNDLLTEFGWDGKLNLRGKVDSLEAEVRREIGRAQATGWLGHVEQQDVKVQELAKAFDRAIEECEELDGLFTLYSHELDTLAADIEYIEAQSQGLQVQTANQKLLRKELQNLLSTLRISDADLQDLHYGALDNPRGVANVEHALATLYMALVQIDPDIRQNKQRQINHSGSGISAYANNELGEMRAVREKKNEYNEHSQAFILRFTQHMNGAFKSLDQVRDDEITAKSLASDSSSSLSTQRTARQDLWLYSGMVLFVREVNSYEWKTLIKSYEMNIRESYQEQFRSTAMSSRREARKTTGEEQEALFTYQEKEKADDSLTSSAARKLTVKRGKTVKNAGLKPSFGHRQDGKPDAWEIFQQTLEKQAGVVAEEQNFMVYFFHLSSQSNVDFLELVSGKVPEERRLPNLTAKIPFEPDKAISSTIQASIEAIYSFWLNDLQSQLEWVLNMDQLQGVGVLCALEHVSTAHEDSNQEFITSTIRTLHGRLKGHFSKFVDEQIKAIEETKVKLKKRKGIISFMRTFPVFSAVVEGMIPEHMVELESLEVRFILNDAYTKILRAMWESLTFIAKDDSAVGGVSHSAAPASGDPEDKEALNYHILLIENMNHYIEEVDTHHNVVLEEWKEKASQDMFTHLTQYTDAVIRRPLGKWLDFVESIEAVMKTSDSLQNIASKPSHSRSTCKKIVKSHDSSEVKKGIDTLKKRIEKHFGDVDDPTTMSKGLIARVLEECHARYAHAHDRMRLIIDKVYEKNVEIDWNKDDISKWFAR